MMLTKFHSVGGMLMTCSTKLMACLAVVFAMAAAPVYAAADTKVYDRCETVRTVTNKAEASWYGPGFHGRLTANGEVFNMNAMTAAHKTLKLGTRILVENVDTGMKAVLRVNDRGPYIPGRTLDVSKKAADVLGFREEGLARIKMSVCA